MLIISLKCWFYSIFYYDYIYLHIRKKTVHDSYNRKITENMSPHEIEAYQLERMYDKYNIKLNAQIK